GQRHPRAPGPARRGLDPFQACEQLRPSPGLPGLDAGAIAADELLQPLDLRLLPLILLAAPFQPLDLELHGAAVGAGILLYSPAFDVPCADGHRIEKPAV